MRSVKIGGREVPLALIGVGAGGLLFVGLRLLKGGRGPAAAETEEAAGEGGYNLLALIRQLTQDVEARFTGVSGEIGEVRQAVKTQEASVTSSLAQQRAEVLGQLAAQTGGLRAEYRGGLAELRQSISGGLTQVQADVTGLEARTKAELQKQSQQLATAQGLTARNLQQMETRLGAVEGQTARTQKALRNVMRYEANITSSMLAGGEISQAVYNQAVTPYVQKVIIPYGALGAEYEGL